MKNQNDFLVWKLKTNKKIEPNIYFGFDQIQQNKKKVKKRKIVDENRLNSLICNCNIEFKKKNNQHKLHIRLAQNDHSEIFKISVLEIKTIQKKNFIQRYWVCVRSYFVHTYIYT